MKNKKVVFAGVYILGMFLILNSASASILKNTIVPEVDNSSDVEIGEEMTTESVVKTDSVVFSDDEESIPTMENSIEQIDDKPESISDNSIKEFKTSDNSNDTMGLTNPEISSNNIMVNKFLVIGMGVVILLLVIFIILRNVKVKR